MLSSLPKLLGRGFVVGFILPSALFCLYIQYLSFVVPDLSNLDNSIEALKVTPFIFTVLLLSVVLIALNRTIIRMLEGYGKFNPFYLLKPIHIAIFKWRVLPLLNEAKRIDELRRKDPQAKSELKNFGIRLYRVTQSYPARRQALLPTSFGNAMRSFETYSGVVYGLEAIAAWPRIYISLPKEVKEQIDDGRSIIDFSANLFVLSIISIFAYVYKYYSNILDINNVPIIFAPLLCAMYSWINLPSAARQWGVTVKSTIEMFRPKLAKGLGLEMPKTADKEREMWRHVSALIVFRSEAAYIALDEFKKKTDEREKSYKISFTSKM